MGALVSILADLAGPGMKRELRGGVEDGLLIVASSIAFLIGTGFGLLALYIWLEHTLGALEASIILAALAFFLCAIVLLLLARRRRLRARQRAAARATAGVDFATTRAILQIISASPLLMMALGAGITAAGYVSRKRR
ncbi:hypothetical protein [Cohaesibacter haloalkalitolerans]|uniref:hypothetical protein n=1 Tax=Cohaesibacter haloalkalitolerans TaxID=1162980 RepID=UPI000E65503B|nr:hypothetical protein [Cohaesibacter haloalkalitolerans]